MTRRQFRFWGFRSPRELVREGTGPLEQRLLEMLWSDGAALTVRDAVERLGSPAAYTTVMTTLDRLYKKGLLVREKAGRAFVYRTAVTRDALARDVARGVMRGVLDAGHPALPLLSTLVDAVTDRDAALLDHLERLVQAKRRALRGEAPE